MASFRPYNFIKDGYIADYADAATTYHGFYNADPQTAVLAAGSIDTSKGQFLIAKETISGGNTVAMKWASTAGSPLTYNQIWNNRAALTYI